MVGHAAVGRDAVGRPAVGWGGDLLLGIVLLVVPILGGMLGDGHDDHVEEVLRAVVDPLAVGKLLVAPQHAGLALIADAPLAALVGAAGEASADTGTQAVLAALHLIEDTGTGQLVGLEDRQLGRVVSRLILHVLVPLTCAAH